MEEGACAEAIAVARSRAIVVDVIAARGARRLLPGVMEAVVWPAPTG